MKPESATTRKAEADFKHVAMAERIRLAAKMERKAVAGPWTAEKGPYGAGIRNIAKMQIARMTGPTLNNRKLTTLVLRPYCGMSIRGALHSLPPHSF